jgi:hypothetical protein
MFSMMAWLGAASLGLAQQAAPAVRIGPQGPPSSVPPATRVSYANDAGGTTWTALQSDSAPPPGSPVVAPQPGTAAGHGEYTQGPTSLEPGTVDAETGRDQSQLYVSADYVLWRLRGTTLPPIIANNIPVGFVTFNSVSTFINGIPSQVITPQSLPVVFQVASGVPGGERFNFGDQPGGRGTIGWWFDTDHDWGVEASFFILEHQNFNFSNASGDSGPVAFPSGLSNQIFIVPTGLTTSTPTLVGSTPVVIVTAASAFLQGTATNEFWGVEANFRCRCFDFGPAHFDVLAGGRYIDLKESVITSEAVNLEQVTVPPVTPLAGTTAGAVTVTQTAVTLSAPFSATFSDRISAHNQMFGPQVGATFDVNIGGGLSVNGYGKVMFGDNHQTFGLTGNTLQTLPTTTVTPGGVLVAPQNSGNTIERDRIVVAPELNLNVSYQVTSHLRAFIGYDILYITDVARPGPQFATATTTAQVTVGGNTIPVNLVRPGFAPNTDDFWVQGLNVGLELRY